MYHSTAQGLAALGRGPDTMLVHMTPGEVQGLQKLALSAGGSLTTNPHTGLPEAGFLSSILPMMAGAALNAAFPGLGSLGTAALVGGGSYLLNPNQGLMGGLMAGLGAYGGAGLGSALSGFGEGALNAAAGSARDIAEGAALGMQDPMVASAVDTNVLAQNQAAAEAAKAAATNASTVDKLGAGAKAAFEDPTGFYKTLNKDMGKWGLAAAATPLLMGAAQSAARNPNTLNVSGGRTPSASFYNTRYSPGAVNPRFGQPGEPYYLGQGYSPGAYGPTMTAADGGLMMNPMQNPNSAYPTARFTSGASEGGLASFNVGGSTGLQKDYAAGGKLLRGPGDGMSDSIPAVIQGPKPQRAALADGEFVIPADVVSHLGNGSTEAGSKQLYKMMDKVRRARTGNPKQGRQINPNKFMPA